MEAVIPGVIVEVRTEIFTQHLQQLFDEFLHQTK